MRKVLVALLLAAAIGCTKDFPSEMIVGDWALVEYFVTNDKTGTQVSATTDVKLWTFHKSGSAYVNGATPLTYTISGKRLRLIYVNNGNEANYEIWTLSPTNLEVYWHTNVPYVNYGYNHWYTFTKMK